MSTLTSHYPIPWGPSSSTKHIRVNEHSFVIRQNLYDFFVQFELLHGSANLVSKYLWIDQICIDQANVIERNPQVGLMSTIYSRSDHVLIWLGSDQPNFAADSGRSYYEIAREFERERKWEDLCLLFDNDYFRRLWVVQEIILAPEIFILINHSFMDWNMIRQCAEDMNRRMTLGIRFYHSRLLSMSARGTPSDRTLKDCVEAFSILDCSDPRDKIYGLMGMVCAKDALTVDYNKSAEDIVLDMGQIFLSEYLMTPCHGLRR